MERLWAPWRAEYIQMAKPAGCILCEKPREGNDATNYILYRGKKNFVIMNKYPYNPGHLMVAPYRHVASPEELDDDELHEHYEIVRLCLKVLRETFSPQGFNLGMNLGKVSGAGIDEHIHTHIVPRWQGDSNFMPVLCDVKVISESMTAIYEKLKERF
ncbi:MAG: HIT domain-containing protein [Chloroflexota bacterium]